jgi:AcrR family transcriptional regulator
MGIVERKERQRKEVHDSILEAAWKVVNEEGWQSLSIRKIADAIEYSVPVVYDHFENKEAILSEFNRQGFKLLGDKLKEAKAHHHKASKQLEAIALAYWDFAFENKEYYQLMYGLGMPTCESLSNVPELTAFVDVIHSTINQLLIEGNGAEADTWMKVHSFWSMLHGLVSINLMAPPVSHMGLTPEQMNKMILTDFIAGFLKGLEK